MESKDCKDQMGVEVLRVNRESKEKREKRDY
jgi:hypothetical protein